MGSVTMHPARVRAWGTAAQAGGADVRSAKAKVTEVDDDMGTAGIGGMVCRGASHRYTDAIASGVGTVADDVTGTGDKLVSSAWIVQSTDEASVALFTRNGGHRS